ncbi:MOSC domain-containing protein [Sphingomonas melonis]|uniref:MOSC domain-containing protein n=1 Tax=uncultured Sphingomonas sp. TaxID=158754 RepID=UPI0025D91464|nr:MOSC domain-containing protein [uncultured Sphingomonas sp.]
MDGSVVAVARSAEHTFSKQCVPDIMLLQGLGVAGDAHAGVTVKHRSRVAVDPHQPNLRQVHLLHVELFEELSGRGFQLRPGDLGENILTRGIDLLALPTGTTLAIGGTAQIEVTGLRNPCAQIERFSPGLLGAVLDRGPNDELIRKAGVMGVVRVGGVVHPGDPIMVHLPSPPHIPLERV